MGNIIQLNSATNNADSLIMSNGQTNVLISVLVLSGSQLAETEEEKRLIVWLAEKDQNVVGIGTVGFDLSEMPWNIHTFEKNKLFLLQTISASKLKTGWEYLSYSPNTKLLFPLLDKFYQLVLQINIADVSQENLDEWLAESTEHDPIFCGFPVCPKHHTLLTVFGCQICNN